MWSSSQMFNSRAAAKATMDPEETSEPGCAPGKLNLASPKLESHGIFTYYKTLFSFSPDIQKYKDYSLLKGHKNKTGSQSNLSHLTISD